jgi:hypothetical protein
MSTTKIVDLSRYQAGFDFFAFQQGGGLAVVSHRRTRSNLALAYRGPGPFHNALE